jgi:hypothetical protein
MAERGKDDREMVSGDNRMTETSRNDGAEAVQEPRKPLTPAAERALAEAEARRREAEVRPDEVGGRRDGLDPVRYGDWEKKGIAIDF